MRIVPRAGPGHFTRNSTCGPYPGTVTDSSTAGWYPDPEGRTGLERWWTGAAWGDPTRSAAISTGAVAGGGAGSAQDYTVDYGSPPYGGDPYAADPYGTAPYGTTDPYGTDFAPAQDFGETPWGGDYSGPANEPGHRPGVTITRARPQTRQEQRAAGSATTVRDAAAVTATRLRGSVRGIQPKVWILVAGIVAAVLVVSLAVVVGSAGDAEDPLATGGTGPGPTTSAPGPALTRIIDREAGVAYPYLGPGWMEFDLGPMLETVTTAGQYIVTQEETPAGIFIAQVTSGLLVDAFGYAGPGSFAQTIRAVQDSVRANYYPSPNEVEDIRDEAAVVDQAPAYLLEFNLTWDVAGYDSTGERAALMLIDTGRESPALFYISIPNTHAELYGIVDRLLAEIELL